jgi:isoprenylcysteine carboxyl methyltransferase (ICMT) family protein YpbQ
MLNRTFKSLLTFLKPGIISWMGYSVNIMCDGVTVLSSSCHAYITRCVLDNVHCFLLQETVNVETTAMTSRTSEATGTSNVS